MKPFDIALGLAVPVLWGVGFTVAKPTLAHFPPLLMLALVYGATALCLARNLGRIETPLWRLFLVSTLVTTTQGGLIFSGLARLPASTAVLVLQLGVPFSVLFAWPLVGERPTPARLCGIALAFAGVAVVAGAPQAATSWIPVLLVAAGSAVWALGQAAARRLSRDHGTVFLAGIAAAAVPQALAASALLESGQWTAIRTATTGDWAILAVVILAGYVAAYSIWYGLLRRYRVDQVTPFAFLMPLFGVVASALLLGETLALGQLAGGAVIMLGLAIVVLARQRSPARLEQA
jgi:O-acetylserine/cysteine efflux transporter